MKTKIIIIITVIIVLLGLVVFGLTREAQNTEEQELLTILTATITQDKLYDSFTNIECLEFTSMEATTEFYAFSIYEKHDKKCPGDPNTRPRVDTFRVMKTDQSIYHYNLLTDSYSPYNAAEIRR